MSIADKLTYLNATKQQLREAINSVGGNLTTEDTFRSYADELVSVAPLPSHSSFTWDSSTATPEASVLPVGNTVTTIHQRMRRCILGRDGVRKYYLNAEDSTLKEDNTAAVLDGTDGMVMVEIPKFYYKTDFVGTITTWSISAIPRNGYSVHPAFIKDGVEVDYRYYGAYCACYFDDSDGVYKSGLNLDNISVLVDLSADYLASVSGVYPIVGVTRDECRRMASNTGSIFHQLDFWMVSAVQLLFLVEYQTFNTQEVLGAGNTGGVYVVSSENQSDSPHTVAGASNSIGNGSTNAITGAPSNNKPGIAFMSYRGIENWYGQAYQWVDGHNINNHQSYVTNDRSLFNDSSDVGYNVLGGLMPSVNGYVTNGQQIEAGFLPGSVGGSTSTYWCDYYYQSTGRRISAFGGAAGDGGNAGGFLWLLSASAGYRNRSLSARLAC